MNVPQNDQHKVSCVYAILNEPEKRVYIGRTWTLAYQRWIAHRSELSRNRHPAKTFQEDWNRLGEGGFTFQVLEDGLSRSDMGPAERRWMNRYREQGWDLYNKYRGRPRKRHDGTWVRYRERDQKLCLSRIAGPFGGSSVTVFRCDYVDRHPGAHRAMLGLFTADIPVWISWEDAAGSI